VRYRVDVGRVERALRKLDPPVRDRVLRTLRSLEADPRREGAKRLAGPGELWRVRVGDYRIVYEIRDDRLLVLVVRLGHRREVYRGL
jgi:mRNA interferase RelE/StbE